MRIDIIVFNFLYIIYIILYCHGYSVRDAFNHAVLADQWRSYTELAKRAH